MMGTKRSTVARGAGLALVAVLVGAAAPAAAHGQEADRPSSSVTLTKSDNGNHVRVDVGDTVTVDLKAFTKDGAKYAWESPQSSDPAVLARTSDSLKPDGGVRSVFRAKHPGTATISTPSRCVKPGPSRPCPAKVEPWSVVLTVK